MRIYTEEQVRQILYKALWERFGETEEDFLKQLTPIELPSDEEIMNNAYTDRTVDDWEHEQQVGFELGAKWMKEEILNQSKQPINEELLIVDFDKVQKEWIEEANGMTDLEKLKYYNKKIQENENR